MKNLAYLYYIGLRVKQDYTKKNELYQKSAYLGNYDSQIFLGDNYLNSRGYKQDYAKALECYNEAADHESLSALCRLGDIYRDGKGVKQDYSKAIEYY